MENTKWGTQRILYRIFFKLDEFWIFTNSLKLYSLETNNSLEIQMFFFSSMQTSPLGLHLKLKARENTDRESEQYFDRLSHYKCMII